MPGWASHWCLQDEVPKYDVGNMKIQSRSRYCLLGFGGFWGGTKCCDLYCFLERCLDLFPSSTDRSGALLAQCRILRASIRSLCCILSSRSTSDGTCWISPSRGAEPLCTGNTLPMCQHMPAVWLWPEVQQGQKGAGDEHSQQICSSRRLANGGWMCRMCEITETQN